VLAHIADVYAFSDFADNVICFSVSGGAMYSTLFGT
jgi:hypothetical protein